MSPSRTSVLPAALLAVGAIALVASGVRPHDRLTWLLEVLPVLIAVPLLVATRVSFPLTPLAYWLVALHCLVLILGAHYTYARVPLGFWIQDWFGFARNHYDRIGHGYPSGVWDQVNLMPILRRGTTATPMALDFEGRPEFLIDAAVYPGSSGSPVFVYQPEPLRLNHSMGSKFLFAGVVAAVSFREEANQQLAARDGAYATYAARSSRTTTTR